MQESALYLEADEDITSAIDKLTRSTSKSVQIVVPKRSTMLQSIINLKLLKKAAENNGKELVLVTSDRIATELAGRVGLAVAPSLGAKAVMAEVEKPEELDKTEEVIEADDPVPPQREEGLAKPKPPRRPLLSRKSVAEAPAPAAIPEPDADAGSEPAAAPAKKRPRVPNFGKLQRRAMWLGLAVVLVVGYLAVMYLRTTAKVTLFMSGSKVSIDTSFTADPTMKTSDLSSSTLAGQLVSVTKDLSGPFTPTGTKDEGTKATGTITIANCYDSNPHAFVTGTRFTAPDGKLFRSTEDVTVSGGQGSFFGCTTPGTVSVNVQADQNGDSYNEGAASYGIPGLPSSQTGGSALCPQCKITAKGGQMAGGTSKTVTVVQQSDVDGEKAALLTKDKDASSRDLNGHVPSGYVALSPSEASNVVSTTPGPAVGAEGSTGSLQIKVTYTVIAVKKSEYQKLLQAQELKQIGQDNEIYDDGLADAQVTAGDKESNGRQAFHLTTEAYGGKKVDHAALATQLKGKRYSDAVDLAGGLPGVTKVEILLTPGWASSLPSRVGNIVVTVKAADKQQ